jgi:two-component system response regulator DctR
MNPPNQTVYVCDDEDAVRGALGFLLRTRGLDVSLHASGPELLNAVDRAEGPVRGVFVLDLRMEPLPGTMVHDQLRARGIAPRCPVIFLSGHGDIATAVRVMQQGAISFLEKPSSDETLVELVRQALALEAENWRGAERREALCGLWERLSPQQRRVMLHVEAGRPNKVIADRMGLTERAIEEHKRKLFAKLGLRAAAELATLAAEMRAAGLALEPFGGGASPAPT